MKGVVALSGVIVALVLVSVTITNRSVDDSQVVADLNSQITALARENTILQASVADAGSLTALSDKITAAGFTDTKTIAALTVPSAVALAK